MVGFTRKVMGDKRGTMSAGRDGIAGLVETMLTADGFRLTASGPDEGRIRATESAAGG